MKQRILLMVGACLLATTVQAAGLDALLDGARKAYLAGDQLGAAQRLKEAVLSLWDEVPLTATNVRLVTDQETYATRPDNPYASGEPIYLVTQLMGYGLRKAGELFTINIVTDFYVLRESGEVIGGLQKFGRFDLTSPMPVTDFRLDLTYRLTDAPAGVYVIQTVINDQNSGKTTRFDQKIRIQ